MRDVPLDPADVPILRRHLLATGRPEEGALVFADDHDDPLNAIGAVRHVWARVVEAARRSPSPSPASMTPATRGRWRCSALGSHRRR